MKGLAIIKKWHIVHNGQFEGYAHNRAKARGHLVSINGGLDAVRFDNDDKNYIKIVTKMGNIDEAIYKEIIC